MGKKKTSNPKLKKPARMDIPNVLSEQQKRALVTANRHGQLSRRYTAGFYSEVDMLQLVATVQNEAVIQHAKQNYEYFSTMSMLLIACSEITGYIRRVQRSQGQLWRVINNERVYPFDDEDIAFIMAWLSRYQLVIDRLGVEPDAMQNLKRDVLRLVDAIRMLINGHDDGQSLLELARDWNEQVSANYLELWNEANPGLGRKDSEAIELIVERGQKIRQDNGLTYEQSAERLHKEFMNKRKPSKLEREAIEVMNDWAVAGTLGENLRRNIKRRDKQK